MFLSIFMVSAMSLALATALLMAIGRRIRVASRLLGTLVAAVVIFCAGWLAAAVWSLDAVTVQRADLSCFAVAFLVVLVRPVWNPIGQAFMGTYVAAALTYLVFAGWVTLFGGLAPVATLASAMLWILEGAALFLTSTFVFETCDVMCRVRHSRSLPDPDPSYFPKVSLHIAAYNEPPDMLIETIRTAEQLDYPDFEIVVVDNNTHDPQVWQPVQAYCDGRPNVTFVHVDPWPGYKSGALNLALNRLTSPDAEIVGVIDSDYLVSPNWLHDVVGYFADPNVAFVQTPQDYREYAGSTYFTACYDAYRYFFATSMPSRNERNSIIFAGTMGLLRRELLGSIGGWDEWCITEDAETSLRLLRAGYAGVFVGQSYGKGIMPLTFFSLKSQRFRWCFGGMQILRRHWRSLMPWDRDPHNHLSLAQRADYLVGGLQWLNDFVCVCFTVVLLTVTALLLSGHSVSVRPLIGPTIVLPAVLLTSGLLRAVWALRRRTDIGFKRAVLAFGNWLSLSWTVGLACLQGLTRREGVFLRTPKVEARDSFRAAFAAARTETVLCVVLVTSAIALALAAHPTVLLLVLVAWQALVYGAAPLTSWLAQRTPLPPELEERRRTEEARERFVSVLRPVAFGAAAATAGVTAVAVAVFGFGSTHAGRPSDPFSPPQQSNGSGPAFGVLPPASTTAPPSSGQVTTGPRTGQTRSGTSAVASNRASPSTAAPGQGTTTSPSSITNPAQTGAAIAGSSASTTSTTSTTAPSTSTTTSAPTTTTSTSPTTTTTTTSPPTTTTTAPPAAPAG